METTWAGVAKGSKGEILGAQVFGPLQGMGEKITFYQEEDLREGRLRSLRDYFTLGLP